MHNNNYPDWERNVNWKRLAGTYANRLYAAYDIHDEWDFKHAVANTGKNPLVEALRDDPELFVMRAKNINKGKLNLTGISRAVVLLQMQLYDLIGGPDGDNKTKAQRRHWYAYFKQFAQMLGFATGKIKTLADGTKGIDDKNWSGMLSTVYKNFVLKENITYRQLWVDDASRMMEIFGDQNKLTKNVQLLIAVEKDSLFADFVPAAQAMGAMAVISGKGKNSFAATEKMLRSLGWSENESTPVQTDELGVIVLSDYDYDGRDVIQPTFGEQLRRYNRHVIEGRIGVEPEQVKEILGEENVWDASYQVKLLPNHSGYKMWGIESGLYMAQCTSCGSQQPVVGADTRNEWCHQCGDDGTLMIHPKQFKTPHGFEVESLKTSDYHIMMVRQFLEMYDWSDVVYDMRIEAVPDEWTIASDLTREVLEKNELYVKVKEAENLLAQARYELENQVEQMLREEAEVVIEDEVDEWYRIGESPTEREFAEYVERAGRRGWAQPFRPFNLTDRNNYIAEKMREMQDIIEQAEQQDIQDYPGLLDKVNQVLNR